MTTINPTDAELNNNQDPFYSDSNQMLLLKSMKEMEETGGKIHYIDLDV